MGTVSYVSLAEVRVATNANSNSEDTELLKAARWASARIDEHTGETFAPRLETRYPRIDPRWAFARYLMLPNCAVELVSVKDAAGNELTVDTHYRTFPRGETPFLAIDAGYSWRWRSMYNDCSFNVFDAFNPEITAYWCFRHRYAEAWQAAGTLDGDITDSAASFSLSDQSLVSPGNLIRIGSEFMVIDAIDAEDDTLTVTRAARGTTAAAHANGAAVEIFEVEPVINRAATRLAGLMIVREGSYETTSYDGITTIQYPTDMPAEVANILAELKYPPVPGDGALVFN